MSSIILWPYPSLIFVHIKRKNRLSSRQSLLLSVKVMIFKLSFERYCTFKVNFKYCFLRVYVFQQLLSSWFSAFYFVQKRKLKTCFFLFFFFNSCLAPSQSLVPKETPATAPQGSVPRPGKAHLGNISRVELTECEGTTAVLRVPGSGWNYLTCFRADFGWVAAYAVLSEVIFPWATCSLTHSWCQPGNSRRASQCPLSVCHPAVGGFHCTVCPVPWPCPRTWPLTDWHMVTRMAGIIALR